MPARRSCAPPHPRPGLVTAPTDQSRPSRVIAEKMRQLRREDARLAAMIVLAESDRISEPVIDFLRRINFVSDRRIAKWMAVAGVHPFTLGADLSVAQRDRLAGQLVLFSKDTSS